MKSPNNLHSNPPQFSQYQQVHFLGGNGIIVSCQPDAGNWLYGVKMPITTEADMGRVGSETVILVPEIELYLVNNADLKEA